jgi:competence protein ComEC
MKTFVMLLILLSASRVRMEHVLNGTVVWNIGQGQWVTVAENDSCLHFDMGGEFFPWRKIHALCGERLNKVYLSHWDWDHIGALAQKKFSKNLPRVCIASPPQGPASAHKQKLLQKFERCPLESAPKSDSVSNSNLFRWKPKIENSAKASNDNSQIYLYRKILLPGDSPQKQELLWSQELPLGSTRVLVLGHHGSRTSTSLELLEKLPHLQMAISSARWKRYSHPHSQTVAKLKRAQRPLLRTEDWGNIWIE